jgi:hypothetical protein
MPLGIWIGTSDPLFADVQAFVARLPTGNALTPPVAA